MHASWKKSGLVLTVSGNDANHENGAFARYIAVKGDIQMHIPDNVSFEEAASVGVGVLTTGYALFHILGLPMPRTQQDAAGKTILIYGGSTATGTIANQFAKMYPSHDLRYQKVLC